MKVLLVIFSFVFLGFFVSCSKPIELEEPEHFIVGEWKSLMKNEPKYFLTFRPDKKVKILLRRDNKIVAEEIYTYEIIDENNVKVNYIKPLEISKTSDNLHIKSGCKGAIIDPPILCFKNEFKKVNNLPQ